MAVKDPKKIELAQKRHEVAEDIVAIRNLKKFSQTKKDELIKGLLTEKSTTKYEQYLLNKPNMTVDDKANIEKIIESLKEKKMLTDKNFKKLETINYDSNYIEIGGIKRARENLKAQQNKKTIFTYSVGGDPKVTNPSNAFSNMQETYFMFNTLKKQNELLAEQGMKIPGKNDCIKSIEALNFEGNESRLSSYAFITILGLQLSGKVYTFSDIKGEVGDWGKSGSIWLFSEVENEINDSSTTENENNKDKARMYGLWRSGPYAPTLYYGGISKDDKSQIYPVRPIIK